MKKEIELTVGLGISTLLFGPAVILGALINAKRSEREEEAEQERAIKTRLLEDKAIACEEKFLILEKHHDKTIHEKDLTVQQLEENRKRLEDKVKRLEEENKLQREIIDNNRKAEKFGDVLKML